MNIKWLAYVFVFSLPATLAHAQQGMVTIQSPMMGAKLMGMGPIMLQYGVEPGPNGDHVHVYVDDEEVGILRALKGAYALEKLSAGDHNVCIKVVDKGHTPIGLEKCVQVSVSAASGAGTGMPAQPGY